MRLKCGEPLLPILLIPAVRLDLLGPHASGGGLKCQRLELALVAFLCGIAASSCDPPPRPGNLPCLGQLDQNQSYLEIGAKDGAELAYGGELLNRETPGHYMAPALFTETHNDMRINREEIFGPVASVIRVKDYDAALSTANDTVFGLTAGIVTTSLKHASHFKRNAQAGGVMVNLPTAGTDYHVPFGGRKGSSYGPREQSGYAREFYTIVKTAYTKP